MHQLALHAGYRCDTAPPQAWNCGSNKPEPAFRRPPKCSDKGRKRGRTVETAIALACGIQYALCSLDRERKGTTAENSALPYPRLTMISNWASVIQEIPDD